MKKYLYRSIALHIAAFIVLMVDLPFFHRAKMTIGQAPIIVDLKDVKLGEMTNLPPKAVFGEEDKPATVAEKTPPQYTHEEKTPKPEPEPEPEKIETPKESFVDTAPEPEPKPAPKPEPKPTPKPEPKPQNKPVPKPSKKPTPPKPKAQVKPQPKADKPKTVTNPLKSLIDTVGAMEKELGAQNSPAVIKTGTPVSNMGVEGGTGGSYFSELTITETDAIGGYLRECWNLDPGARGIEGMIIEIRAFLNQDGTIRDVQIVDKARANADPHFRAIAESARRAVISCQNHNNVNIYKIFPEKYADKYKMWNTLLLKFNPMDASVN
ncbi:MAG: hypothetical protein IJ870_00545 [Alphaproteobacteria bacterium]|nr:hypothetical protein [Alphaproteobacteria bacterium]